MRTQQQFEESPEVIAACRAVAEHMGQVQQRIHVSSLCGGILPEIAVLQSASLTTKLRMHLRWLMTQQTMQSTLHERISHLVHGQAGN